MKKLCAMWVHNTPHRWKLLTAVHMKILEERFEHFNKNKTDFVYPFIMMDEMKLGSTITHSIQNNSKSIDQKLVAREGKVNLISKESHDIGV